MTTHTSVNVRANGSMHWPTLISEFTPDRGAINTDEMALPRFGSETPSRDVGDHDRRIPV